MRLAAAPWSARKIAKRSAKHAIWLIFAVATGGAWVFYFNDAPTLAHQFVTGTAGFGNYAAMAGLTFTTYSLGGLMREQVCTYMCPWPRIQAAMTDRKRCQLPIAVTGRTTRLRIRRARAGRAAGVCIDCNQCVAACPMGIDIRDGSQLECINCGFASMPATTSCSVSASPRD